MTEADGRDEADPARLLDYHRMKSAPRKLRLLACACVRRLWPAFAEALDDPAFLGLIDAVERYADGTADRAEFVAARKPFRKARARAATRGAAVQAALNVLDCLSHDAMEAMTAAISNTRVLLQERQADAGAAQCALIRCVFGDLGRPVELPEGWRTPLVMELAHAAADRRVLPGGELDPVRLAVLADALEEAGCDRADVQGHLRGPGPHVRGCWVMDRIARRA